ncbi:acyltransferase family protein [Thermodesulfobacteriota bacterium]
MDIFRGIAILLIVFHHLLPRGCYGTAVDFLIVKSALGVQIFFVIGGYGISAAVSKIIGQKKAAFYFLKKRFSRIYLPYLFSLIFIVLVFPTIAALGSFLKGQPFIFNFQSHLYNNTFLEWIKIITLTQVFSSINHEVAHAFDSFNTPIWYISIIVQCYLAITVSLLFKKSHYYKIIFFLSIVSILTMIPSVAMFIPSGLFLPFWPQFSIGILLFYVINKGLTIPPNWVKIKRNYFFFIGVFLIISFSSFYYFFSLFFFCIVIGFLFWLLLPIDGILINYPPLKSFLGLGKFSYSLYILHDPLAKFIKLFIKNLVPLPLAVTSPIFVIPLVITFSYLWYLFFEKPGSPYKVTIAVLSPLKTIKNAYTQKVPVNVQWS